MNILKKLLTIIYDYFTYILFAITISLSMICIGLNKKFNEYVINSQKELEDIRIETYKNACYQTTYDICYKYEDCAITPLETLYELCERDTQE